MSHPRMRLIALSLLLLTGSFTAARAADEDPQAQLLNQAGTDPGSGWIFGAGLAVTDPGYVGYNRQYTPVPLVFYHYGRFFFAGISAGYLLSNGEHYRFSLVATPEFNRLSASDSPQLTGIQSRQPTLDGGVALDLFGDWGKLNFSVFHDLLDRNNGAGADLGYHYPIPLGDWTLTPGAGVHWESAKLTNYYYGVSAAEAIPGRPAYSPGPADNPYAEVALSTRMSEHWSFRGSLRYTRFSSAIHDSPIVDRSGTPLVFIGFIYNPRGD